MSDIDTGAQHGGSLIRTLHEVALYPQHPPRVATPLYVKSHHHLVVELDLPCLVCGVKNSDLQDPVRQADETINRMGAKAIETHHHLCEDSLALAVALEKFNARVVPGLLRRSGNAQKYGQPFTQEQMEEWIHGDPDNLWCLCDVCHRHPLVGIHAITGPIWGVQDLLKDGYDLTGYHAHSPAEAAALTALPHTVGQASAPADGGAAIPVAAGETAVVAGPAEIVPTPGGAA